ncbi:MAG: hypothetical protein RR444_01795 [Oscillospiraceae bacterium]
MQHSKKQKKAKSYLIVELIVLLLILATIGFFAIPKLNSMLNTSRQQSVDNDAVIVATAAQAWLTQQETAETVLTVDTTNMLSVEDVDQIVKTTTGIDDEVAKTVKVWVKGNQVPECYQLKTVELVKKGFTGKINK